MTMPAGIPALAVVVVRDGQLPAGADETAAAAGGAVLLAGSGTREAAGGLAAASRVWLLEQVLVRPGRTGQHARAPPVGRGHGAAPGVTGRP